MRYHLRTLLIVLAVGPVVLAVAYPTIEERVAYHSAFGVAWSKLDGSQLRMMVGIAAQPRLNFRLWFMRLHSPNSRWHPAPTASTISGSPTTGRPPKTRCWPRCRRRKCSGAPAARVVTLRT